MLRLSFLAIVASLTLLSCATILTGTTDTITITSDPSGAEVFVDGESIGRTPITRRITKSAEGVVLRLEGYEDAEFALQHEMEGAFLGNIILGGLIGSVTDGMTGAVNRYAPDSYFATLLPLDAERGFYQTNPRFAVRTASLMLHRPIGRELAIGVVGEAIETLQAVHPALDLERLRAIYDDSPTTLAFSDRVVEDWLRSTGG